MASVKPVAGKRYVIVRGDTLWDIADIVYGSGWKYQIIWDANKSNLRSGDPNLIYPGEELWIPTDPDRNITQSNSVSPTSTEVPDPDEALAVFIDGKRFRPTTATIVRTFDTAADGWTATFRDNLSDEAWVSQRGVFMPYKYSPSEIYLFGKSIGESVIYLPEFKGGEAAGEITAHAFSPSVNIVDSVAEPPYEENNISLENWIKKLIRPFSLSLSTAEADQTAWRNVNQKKLKRIRIGKEEKVFDHISEHLRQKGFVLSNGLTTNLVIRSAPAVTNIVAIFTDSPEDGGIPIQSINAGFDGRQRFRVTVASGKGPRRNFRNSYQDTSIPMNRRELFTVSSSELGDASTAAESRARKRIADALTFEVTTREWFNQDGRLYEPGQFVLYRSKRLFLGKGVELLVREVTYILDNTGRKAVLSLIPPSVYSKTMMEDPWALA